MAKQKTYYTPAQVAERMCVTEKHLSNLRSDGKGPKYVKIKGRIMYEELEVKGEMNRQRSRAFFEQDGGKIVLNWRAPVKAPHLDV